MGALRRLIYQRSGGLCEASGLPLPRNWELHHRRPRGMGGTSRPDTDTAPNVLALTPEVHNMHPDSVHMRRWWSEPRGYLLSQHEPNPAAVPVLLHGRDWVTLTTDGGYEPVNPHVTWEIVCTDLSLRGKPSWTVTGLTREEALVQMGGKRRANQPHIQMVMRPEVPR